MKIYLLRESSGAPEDFWPLSAHRTKDGAVTRMREKADEYGLTVRPYGPNDGPSGPDGYTGELQAFPKYHDGRHLFIGEMELED
jgi:hypothetical protein